jgi:hypothetical protein
MGFSNSMYTGANTLYEGASDLGQMMSTIKLIGSMVFGILAILGGSYMIINNNDNNYHYLTAKIEDVKCNLISQDSKHNKSFDCKFNVEFDLDNKKNKGEFHNVSSNQNYYTGQNIDVTVNKSNINDISMSTMKTRTFGIIILCIALVIMGGGALNYYLSKNYKLYSATQGVQTITNLFRPNRMY